MPTCDIPPEPAATTTEVRDCVDDLWHRTDAGWTNGDIDLPWPDLWAQFGPLTVPDDDL